ncbi:hypothetical protein GCM10027020_09020 [Nocardioides salsibiostraticola]
MSPIEGRGPVVICTYRVRDGEQAAFERWLEVHAPTLRELGLITDFPAQVLRRPAASMPVYVEVFEWASTDAAERASEVPEVIAIWEPMAALCESRDDRPGLEFASFTRLGQQG